ncbi:uncharacterized protein LOC134271523 [Saccostrea cucullata]|uniref:uncharacterized protein LOC134271523 n=1 Tax=Saccostrea cuccullata TaxID=36930 RepID=UPI002ED22E2C
MVPIKKEALQKFFAEHRLTIELRPKRSRYSCAIKLRLNIAPKSEDDYITRNIQRRTVGGVVYSSPENTSLTWSSNLITVPLIDIFDIQHYLCTESGWTKERFNNRKKENSFKLFSNGHIHGVELCNLENDMLYMRARCVPETRQSGDPYKLWVLLNKSGQIFSAECKCIAGDGSCKHVAAALFGILAFSTDLHDSAGPSVTDVPAYWTAPKRICKPVAVEDLDIRADVTTARSDGPTHQDGYFPIPEDQLDKKRIEKDMVKLLKNCKVPGVALYTLSDSDSDLEDIEFKEIILKT